MRLKSLRTKVIYICCGILGLVFLFGHQSRAASKLFGNMTYITDSPYIAEKITLANGWSVVRNGRLHLSLYYEGHYVYGDFNQDGLKDAAVIVSGGEGNVDLRVLAFLINDGGQLVHRASHALGNSVIINSLRARSGKVVVDMFVHRALDCRAGPTRRVKTTYDYLNPNPTLISAVWIRPPQALAHGAQELREIYNTSIPDQIRQNIDREIQIHTTCPECEWGAVNGEQFNSFYSRKFLVIRVSPNNVGVWAVIVVDSNPKTAFRLLLSRRGEDKYDVISIEELPDSLEEELIRQLQSPNYHHYWL